MTSQGTQASLHPGFDRFTTSLKFLLPRLRGARKLGGISQQGGGSMLDVAQTVLEPSIKAAAKAAFGGLVMFASIQPTTAQTAQAFDLVCDGKVETSGGTLTRTQREQRVYHIDLASKRYCQQPCKGARQIKEVRPTVLLLAQEQASGISDASENETFINRETGAVTSSFAIAVGGTLVKSHFAGQCERRKFSGFTTPKTKF